MFAPMSMPEREHTSKQYEQQLRTVKEKLLLMSHRAEMAIADATRALVERRPSLAEHVIDDDDELDRLELEVDDMCFEILAREQPVASDLRFIATAIKIVGDIERIGDNGVNIARRALEIMTEPELDPIIDVPVMARAAQRILKESLDAFVNEDVELAERAIESDRSIHGVARSAADVRCQKSRACRRPCRQYRRNGRLPCARRRYPAWASGVLK